MTLERRAQALLALVEGDRDAQCGAILAEARGRASALLGEAHAEARARMREVFAEERRRAHEVVAAAKAKVQTRRRLHEQHRNAALLVLGGQRLPHALRKRWEDGESRRIWVDATVAMAARVLPRSQWRIAHGPEMAAAEQKALCARVLSLIDAEPTFVVDAGIVAGLRIDSGGNVVDGTMAGLISDSAEVGAQLLRHLESEP